MPSTYSSLKIQLMATGENNTTWGDVTNINLGTALEEAIVGSADVAFSNADVTLTLTDTNASQSARNMRLNLTGTATAGYNLIVPAIEKPYIINNATDGTITVKNATGTGIAIPAGKTTWVFNNGTNVVNVTTYLSSLTLGSAMGVGSGGTGASTFTSNGVLLGNGTSAISATAAGTTGQVLVGNTGGAPSWATLSGIGVTSFSAGTTGLTPSTGTTGAVTLAGTLGVANGGTGATSLTSGYLVKGNGTSAVSASVVYDTGTNVGIGTTSPAYKLDVAGDIALKSNATYLYGKTSGGSATRMFGINSGNDVYIGSIDAAATSIRFNSGGTDWAYLNGTGLGIGTTSPQRPLHAAYLSSNVGAYTAVLQGQTGGYGAGVSFQSNLTGGSLAEMARITADGEAAWNTTASTQNAGLRFYTALNGTVAEKMRLDASGRLAVGTTGPINSNMITAYGSSQNCFVAQVTNNIYSTFQGFNASTVATFQVDGSGNGYFAGNVGIGTSSPLTKLHLLTPSATAVALRAGNSVSYAEFQVDASGYSQLVAPGGVQIFNTNGSERMRIDSSGNVGIGTSSPQTFTQITGDVSDTDGTGFNQGQIALTDTVTSSGLVLGYRYQAGVAEYARIQARNSVGATNLALQAGGGNVGIGTASPGYKLEVRGDAASVFNWITSFNSTAAGGYGAGFLARAGSLTSYFYQAADGSATLQNNGAYPLLFGTNSTERMRIDSSGNVGIGTSSPTSGFKLDVNGSVVASSYAIGPVDQHLLYDVDASNIGIRVGTGGPYYKIGTTGSSNLRLDNSSGGDVALSISGTTYATLKNTTGNFGIGTSSPAQKLHVATTAAPSGTTQSFLRLTGDATYGADFGGGLIQGTGPIATISTVNAGTATERMRIDSSGNVLVGTTANTVVQTGIQMQADVGSGASNVNVYHASGVASGVPYMQFAYNASFIGSITQNGTTAVAYNTTSDYRLKDITGSVTNSGAYIDALNPVQGSWKADGSRFIGLIAHEVQDVSETQIATGTKDGEEMQAMDYSAPEIIANLIAEIQSLRARVAQLEGN